MHELKKIKLTIGVAVVSCMEEYVSVCVSKHTRRFSVDSREISLFLTVVLEWM